MSINKHIGIIFTDNMNSGLQHDFFSPILNSFKRRVEREGYSVSFINIDKSFSNPERFYDQVKKYYIDGVFLVNLNNIGNEIKELIDADLPVVTIDYKVPGAVSISSDNDNGIRELVNYVYSMGHTKIAFLTGDKDSEVAKIRLHTFKDECANLNIIIPNEYIRESNFRDMRAAGRITEELLALRVPPTCILYQDDYAAIGGINIIRARGLDIAKDISICGFDGINIISHFDPKLSTVKQDVQKIGEEAAEQMMRLVENHLNGDGSEIIIPTTIERGNTVGRIFLTI